MAERSDPLTPAAVRALFPALQRPGYLNAAASSPLCLPVERANAEHLQETLKHGDVGFPQWLARRELVREQVARLLGATAPEVAFLPSTSMGFHVTAHYLKALGITEVLTLGQEFPSTTLPLLHLGLSLRVLEPRADGSYPPEDLEAALGPRTGAIVASAVQFASGFKLDVPAVAALCKARGLKLAVNAAQALGQVPVDVRVGIHFLAATSHKWLMGGYGVGLFYGQADLVASLPPPFAGWLSVPPEQVFQNFVGSRELSSDAGTRVRTLQGVTLRHDAPVLEVGGGNHASVFGLGAALELIDRCGIQTIAAHNGRLQAQLREGLARRGFRPNAPPGSGLCVFPVQGAPLDVVRALLAHGVVTTPRGVGVRVSTHVFNDPSDVERLFWAIDDVGVQPA